MQYSASVWCRDDFPHLRQSKQWAFFAARLSPTPHPLEKATGSMMITLHLKIVYRGESKTQFVSNVFDVVVRWYSRFRDTFAIRRAGSYQHNQKAFELRAVISKTDRGRINIPDDIRLRISICPTTQWREARLLYFFFCRKLPRRKRANHVRCLGIQRSMLGTLQAIVLPALDGQRGDVIWLYDYHNFVGMEFVCFQKQMKWKRKGNVSALK